ncbi:hypothetical protein KM043_016412 [Ampulex compressa]|nr:hypothetical protein KM043_016412 [Ampulex compressa]
MEFDSGYWLEDEEYFSGGTVVEFLFVVNPIGSVSRYGATYCSEIRPLLASGPENRHGCRLSFGLVVSPLSSGARSADFCPGDTVQIAVSGGSLKMFEQHLWLLPTWFPVRSSLGVLAASVKQFRIFAYSSYVEKHLNEEKRGETFDLRETLRCRLDATLTEW